MCTYDHVPITQTRTLHMPCFAAFRRLEWLLWAAVDAPFLPVKLKTFTDGSLIHASTQTVVSRNCLRKGDTFCWVRIECSSCQECRCPGVYKQGKGEVCGGDLEWSACEAGFGIWRCAQRDTCNWWEWAAPRLPHPWLSLEVSGPHIFKVQFPGSCLPGR